MKKKTALAYCHPGTIVLVDDEKKFLENTGYALAKRGFVSCSFTDPKNAYDFLTQKYTPYNLIQSCIDQEIDPDLNARNVNINIEPIRDAVYNSKRFEHITVLVIDHDMPEMSGVEFCRQLKDFPVKKILLTGVATDKQAIDAFNEGAIDVFINKKDPNMEDLLYRSIAELHRKQLEEESNIIISNLVFPRPGYEKSCLGEDVFIDLLDKLVEENEICEYYLSNENGSYVMFNEQGTPSWLVIKDKDEMEADRFLAEDSSPEMKPASPEICKGLEDHTLILHMFYSDEGTINAAEWEAKGLLHPAKSLKGSEETYYYAYITDPNTHYIDKDRLLSFEAYREQLAEQDN